ncbi:MAG: HTH domain-containing protein, partial [Verrucomicrobiae bacterium]|nr:HTH domain-containing protein [Verrucomicrobiae bacterium]
MNLDARILSILRSLGNSPISAADLANQLHVSRSTITAHIAELRRVGFDIPAAPHGGYRLVGTPKTLNSDDIMSRLGTVNVIGRDIRVFNETSSTNDIIDKLAHDGVAEGVVVFAEAQKAGRGRLGRSWFSPKGKGLWFSVLLRPRLRPQETPQITVL